MSHIHSLNAAFSTPLDIANPVARASNAIIPIPTLFSHGSRFPCTLAFCHFFGIAIDPVS